MKDFLSETDREDLKLRHRKERDRRVADRIKAVLLKDKGWRYRAIRLLSKDSMVEGFLGRDDRKTTAYS